MPTGRGWGMAASAVVLLVGGWLLGYVELAVVGTGCVVALVCGRLWLLRRVPLEVHRDIAPTRVPRGDQALGVVTVSNVGRRATQPLRAVDRSGERTVTVDIPRLPRRISHTTSYSLSTHKRGEIAVGPLRLEATDPLGLFRNVAVYGEQATLLVRPKTTELAVLPSGRAANVEGPTSDTAPSGTVTFHTLREYVFGDDLRHIHWRTTARTNKLMVRHLVDTSLPQTIIVLDTRSSSYAVEEDFELAVDITASIALAAVRLGFPITILTAERPFFSAKGGRADTVGLLDQLALVEQTETTDLVTVIDAARPGYGGGSLSVVSSGAEGVELDRLAAARAHFDRTVLIRTGTRLPPLPPALPITTIDVVELAGFAAAWRWSSGGTT